ncbi:MAG TPA: UPF0158 family protein [Polyangia bacterium]
MTASKPPVPPSVNATDFGALASALAEVFDQPRNGPVRAFFDRTTGALESMPRDAEVEGVFDDIVTAPERWVEVSPLPLGDRQRLRARFVEDHITDPHLRLRFSEALAAERPFTRFDALLREQPDLLDGWLSHRAESLQPIVRAWLAALGIEAHD